MRADEIPTYIVFRTVVAKRMLVKWWTIYLSVLQALKCSTSSDEILDDISRGHSANLKWDGDLKRRAKQCMNVEFSEVYIRRVVHRPFVRQYLYADRTFLNDLV